MKSNIKSFFAGFITYSALCMFAHKQVDAAIRDTWKFRKEKGWYAVGFFSAAPIVCSTCLYLIIKYS